MATVGDILKHKGNDVLTIGPEACVHDAARIMVERKIGALLVTAGEELIGIISERDIVTRMAAHSGAVVDLPVREVMTRDIHIVAPNAELSDCLQHCTDKRHRHLPVVDDGKLIGVISMGDLVKRQLADRMFELDQLGAYIAGVPPTDRIRKVG